MMPGQEERWGSWVTRVIDSQLVGRSLIGKHTHGLNMEEVLRPIVSKPLAYLDSGS